VRKLAVAQVQTHVVLLAAGTEENKVSGLGLVKGDGAASARLVVSGARHRNAEDVAVEQLHERRAIDASRAGPAIHVRCAVPRIDGVAEQAFSFSSVRDGGSLDGDLGARGGASGEQAGSDKRDE
jgi:hypothetical protein